MTRVIKCVRSFALIILATLLAGCAARPGAAGKRLDPSDLPEAVVAVTHFGAAGDGRHDDSAAFARAFASGAARVLIPAGRYRLGPAPLTVPPGVQLIGAGNAILLPANGTQVLLRLCDDDQISDLQFAGQNVAKGGYDDDGLVTGRRVRNVALRDLRFADVDRVCITLDHAQSAHIEDCRFDRIGMAVHVDFSHLVWICRNSVDQFSLHGIEIWGNHKFQDKGCSDIIVIGNNVQNGEGCAIWTSGVGRCVFADNIVGGASDVGLDFEWTDDAAMTGNLVQRCTNAGLALFFSCRRISLTGNTIYNDAPITTNPKRPGWWVRSGVWLTGLNRTAYPADEGNREVTITGNTIICAPGQRRAIWIGKPSAEVRLADNQISGADIWLGNQKITGGNGNMQITGREWESLKPGK